MQRLLFGLGAFALTLTLTASNVNAAERRGFERHEAIHHEIVSHEVNHGHYYEMHGVHFHGGYYFPGFDHHHWARQIWNASLRRWEYFDVDLNCYYYWCAPANCYYPVSYVYQPGTVIPATPVYPATPGPIYP